MICNVVLCKVGVQMMPYLSSVNIKTNDNVCSHSLLSKLGIRDVEIVLRTSRMRWFGHVERSVGWISQVRKLDLDTCKKPGRPKKTWNELILNDKRKLDMVCADPLDRSKWKSRLRDRTFNNPILGKRKRPIKKICLIDCFTDKAPLLPLVPIDLI